MQTWDSVGSHFGCSKRDYHDSCCSLSSRSVSVSVSYSESALWLVPCNLKSILPMKFFLYWFSLHDICWVQGHTALSHMHGKTQCAFHQTHTQVSSEPKCQLCFVWMFKGDLLVALLLCKVPRGTKKSTLLHALYLWITPKAFTLKSYGLFDFVFVSKRVCCCYFYILISLIYSDFSKYIFYHITVRKFGSACTHSLLHFYLSVLSLVLQEKQLRHRFNVMEEDHSEQVPPLPPRTSFERTITVVRGNSSLGMFFVFLILMLSWCVYAGAMAIMSLIVGDDDCREEEW